MAVMIDAVSLGSVYKHLVTYVPVTVCILQSLWEEARNYPLYSLLKKKTDYVFVCINEMAVKVC